MAQRAAPLRKVPSRKSEWRKAAPLRLLMARGKRFCVQGTFRRVAHFRNIITNKEKMMSQKIEYRGEVKLVEDRIIYKGQTFNLVGVRTYQNRKGATVLLAEWRSQCRNCGTPYVTARTPTKSAQPAMTCEACRP